jgi:quercetin dioxygenase-like cupin family protein
MAEVQHIQTIIMAKGKGVTAEILEDTMEIQDKLPVLSGFLNEMPVFNTNYNSNQIDARELEEYGQSLKSMIKHDNASSSGYGANSASHPRPDARRMLNAALHQVDIPDEIARIKLESNWVSGKQSGKTLLKSDCVCLVLIAMHQGNEIKKHQSAGPVCIQVIQGSIKVTTEAECIVMKENQLLTLHAKLPHALLASEQSILLLTMMNLNGGTNNPGKDIEGQKEEEAFEIFTDDDRINFPDFPTYPPGDDVYIEPTEGDEVH